MPEWTELDGYAWHTAISIVTIVVVIAVSEWTFRKRRRAIEQVIDEFEALDSKRNSAMELAVAQLGEHEKRISAAERNHEIALDRHAEMTGGRFDLHEDRLSAIEGDAKRLNALCVDIENRRAQDRETAKLERDSAKRRMDEMDDARIRLDERLSRDEHKVDAAFSEERAATEKALSEIREAVENEMASARADWNVRADKIDKALSRGSDAARRHDDLLAAANSKIDQAINERKITRELVDNAIGAHDDAIARRIDACATKPALDGLGKRLAKVESSENRFEHAAKKADELDGWRTDIAKSHMRLVSDMGQALRMLDSQATRIGALEAAQPQAQIVADLVQEVAEQVKDIARALEELQSKFIEGLGDGDDSVPAIMQRRGAEIEALLDIAQHNADTLDLLQRRIIALESADPGEARNRVIAEAYHAGLGSYTEIGLAFGVSRRTALRYAKRYPKTKPQEE